MHNQSELQGTETHLKVFNLKEMILLLTVMVIGDGDDGGCGVVVADGFVGDRMLIVVVMVKTVVMMMATVVTAVMMV